MWKQAVSGGPKLAAVEWTRCWNCSNTFVKSKNGWRTLILRSYSRTDAWNQDVGHKSDSVASIKRSYKLSRDRDEKDEKDRGGVPPGGWLLLIIPISTLGLGIWQVYRWRWKLELIEEMRRKTTADPVPLPDDEQELGNLEYSKVNVRGKFDYSQEMLLGPRSLVNPDDRSGDKSRGVFSSGSSSQNGFHVITPFQLEGKNERILVNRGWINSRDPSKFKHTEETVEIVGVVRKTETRAPFMAKNRPGQTILHYRDVGFMSRILNSNEVFLDLHSIEGIDFSNARQDFIPVPGQTRVTLRNEHVSYFVTWLSLSGITAFMWHRRFIRGLNLL